MVAPVFSYQKGSFSLEVIGPRANVLTADYVANFLDHYLEKIYTAAKKTNSSLRGVSAKKSYMSGVASRLPRKIKSFEYKKFSKNELIKCDLQVQLHLQKAYPRLRGDDSRGGKIGSNAQQLGNIAGKNLSINPALSPTIQLKPVQRIGII